MKAGSLFDENTHKAEFTFGPIDRAAVKEKTAGKGDLQVNMECEPWRGLVKENWLLEKLKACGKIYNGSTQSQTPDLLHRRQHIVFRPTGTLLSGVQKPKQN